MAQDDDRTVLPFHQVIETSPLVRHQRHNGRWFFSVIDVLALLTESPNPRNYWNMLKHRLVDEGATLQIVRLKLRSRDDKLYLTDCVDAETLQELRRLVPMATAKRVESQQKLQGVVYAIGLADGSMVKIGTTTNLLIRLRSLCLMSPVPVVVLWQTSGSSALEHKLHQRFAQRRVYGEWFHFADVDVVAELQAALAELRGHAP
jgi:Meiotically up-regulated gene 113